MFFKKHWKQYIYSNQFRVSSRTKLAIQHTCATTFEGTSNPKIIFSTRSIEQKKTDAQLSSWIPYDQPMFHQR